MKRYCCLLIVSLLLFFFSTTVAADTTLTVLFTHDIHSHLLTKTSNYEGVSKEIGGFAKLKTAIAAEQEKYPQALLVDGGDFAMGTLFQTIYRQQAAELRMLGQLGFDYTTLGNHEFDYGPTGLARMLYTAADSGEPLPRLLTANIDWETTYSEESLLEGAAQLNGALEAVGAKPYELTKRNGVTVAVFGLMGKQAADYAPESGLIFADPIETAKTVVAEIKKEDPKAVIICLSHSGTNANSQKSEDEVLAKKVPELDVIVSAHSHTVLNKPLIVGKTIIVSAGEYTDYLGSLTLSLSGEERVLDYRLIPLDNDVDEDPTVLSQVETYKKAVETTYLSQYGYSFDEVIAHSAFDFTPVGELIETHEEQTIGSLIADAYLYGAAQALQGPAATGDIAVIPVGVIRDSFSRGDIGVADVFNVSSLGIGPDGNPGYPLIALYLTGAELKAVCEVDASISPIMAEAQLYTGGLNFTFNPHRFFLNKVTAVTIVDSQGHAFTPEPETLYRVIADLYTGQMLSLVKELSFNLLAITPKDEKGQPVTDLEKAIIRNETGGELKAWVALSDYLRSFPGKNGLAEIPARYQTLEGRKVVDEDTSLGAKLAHPNKTTLLFAGVILAFLLFCAALIFAFVKLYKRRKAKRAQ